MKRILFVDDEPRVLEGLRRMLRPLRNEWETHFAPSAEAALAVLSGMEFDVIDSDTCMPVDLAVTIRLALQHKDLLAETKRLLAKVKQQDRILEEVQRIDPGVSEVKRDREGVIIVDEIADDYESLMSEIRKTLGDGDE
jgi:CheY-like chemotaxis protein